jgi:hypothetical protein
VDQLHWSIKPAAHANQKNYTGSALVSRPPVVQVIGTVSRSGSYSALPRLYSLMISCFVPPNYARDRAADVS